MHNPNKCNNFVYIQIYQATLSKEQMLCQKGNEQTNKPTKQHKLSHRDTVLFSVYLQNRIECVIYILYTRKHWA